jgi:hypothetical protein
VLLDADPGRGDDAEAGDQQAGHEPSSLALVGVVTDGAVLIGDLARSVTSPPRWRSSAS